MLNTAVIYFVLTAILGAILLFHILRNKKTSKKLAFVHGLLAIIGIVLLIIYGLHHTPQPIESIVLFILVALGGLIMAYHDIAGKTIPKWLAIGHGLGAIVAITLLFLFVFAH